MLQTLYCLSFNNYYNRQIKGIDFEFENYVPFIKYGPFTNINFNPADGINTMHTVNTQNSDFDYLLVMENGEIISRWFVVGATRNVGNGQYDVSLRRDLIVDFHAEVMNGTAYIEKSILQLGNPLLYNRENLDFNQIKQQETLLKDETDCAWIVGYVARNATINASFNLFEYSYPVDYTYDSLSDYFYSQYTSENPLTVIDRSSVKYRIRVAPYANRPTDLQSYIGASYYFDIEGNIYSPSGAVGFATATSFFMNSWSGIYGPYTSLVTNQAMRDAFINNPTRIEQLAQTVDAEIGADAQAIALSLANENGKVIKTPDGYYQVRVSKSSFGNTSFPALEKSITTGAMFDILDAGMDEAIANGATFAKNSDIYPAETYELRAETGTRYYVSLERLAGSYHLGSYSESGTLQGVLPEQRYHTIDAPYDIFAIPLSSTISIYQNGYDTTVAHNAIIAQMAAAAIIEQNGSQVYDVQILPYCPCRYLTTDIKGRIDLRDNKAFWIYSGEDASIESNRQALVVWATSNQTSFDIAAPIAIPNVFPDEPGNINAKVCNECDIWRLNSPNYSGVFEFNVARNGGVDFFNVDCTFKPFSPYIHLNPNFKNMYGRDFNDARGLVCGGDFSMAQTTDEFKQYEIQNKNYYNSFRAQIESNDQIYGIQRAQQKEAALISGVSGAISGASSGAITGAMIGGPGGAVAFGAAGLAGGIAAGIHGATRDLQYSDWLYKENRRAAEEQFNFSLQNIKALPYTLSNIGAQNANNKIFPFVEYYTCTPQEKQMMLDKIKFDGMTTMVIGKVGDYVSAVAANFLKAQLIRLEGLGEDYHTMAEIGAELHKGIFIQGEGG